MNVLKSRQSLAKWLRVVSTRDMAFCSGKTHIKNVHMYISKAGGLVGGGKRAIERTHCTEQSTLTHT